MKKIIVAIVIGFFVSIQAASAAEFNKNLGYGIKNNSDVSKLQEFLTEEGLYSGPITGNFFSLTLKAVKSFQAREQISPVSGFFGNLTRNKVNTIIESDLVESNLDFNSEGNTPAIVEASTTTDVVNKLSEQVEVIKSQNKILQEQLDKQSEINKKIEEQNQIISKSFKPEPVAPPVPELHPALIITKSTMEVSQAEFTFKAVDDTFQVQSLLVENLNPTRRLLIPLSNKISGGSETNMIYFWECNGLKNMFVEKGKDFPLTCTPKSSNDTEPGDVSYAYHFKDWIDRDRETVLIEKGRTESLLLPIGTTIKYLKAVGLNTNHIIEITN